MNRLIIIGNGFDLAHGLKTRFADFIIDYLIKIAQNVYAGGSHSDPLISFNPYDVPYSRMPEINRDNIFIRIDELKNANHIDHKVHSDLLSIALSKVEKLNWVDLEVEYFELLVKTKESQNTRTMETAIKLVNDQLDFMKLKLIEYLKEEESNSIQSINSMEFDYCFLSPIKADEIVTTFIKKDGRPENLYFLNFNYTSIVENHVLSCRKEIPSEINYIHGNLSGSKGSPIFGFGDELNRKYLSFEEEKNNELFKHIKSFEYLRTKNYYSLIRFIESADFQVYLFGHSCGLSDRTMLNQIFEHENCKSIKIFYHEKPDGSNDFTEKTYEISRHFRDKGMLRKKLIPFELSEKMPQPKR